MAGQVLDDWGQIYFFFFGLKNTAGGGWLPEWMAYDTVLDAWGGTLRWLLRVALGRWSIEACFHVAKEELKKP